MRKRVIKILKDICIAQPDFPKITEICVKMIRRIHDADGIKVRCFIIEDKNMCMVQYGDFFVFVECN